MTSRPLPEHGTYGRANGSFGYRLPCDCEPCTVERRRVNKLIRVNRERGITDFVDPSAAREHLQLLHQTMAWDDMAAATGLPLSSLNLIYAGRRTKIRRETEARILATEATPSRAQIIDVTGSTRRIQALLYVGHSLRTLEAECGTSRMRLHKIAEGRQEGIRREHAERIAQAYKRLAFKPPARNRHIARTRNVAKAKGWCGPLAWDGAAIDDPNAQPEASEPYIPIAKGGRDNMRRQEIQHLLDCGESPASIAKQMKRSEKYIGDLISQGLGDHFQTAA